MLQTTLEKHFLEAPASRWALLVTRATRFGGKGYADFKLHMSNFKLHTSASQIMKFVRHLKGQPGYDASTHHVVYGQVGDLRW